MNNSTLFSVPEAPGTNWSDHNAASRALWQAFNANTHPRAPVRLNTNPRMLMLDPAYNTRRISYERYMSDAGVMSQTILEWHSWTRHFLPGDHEKGLPDEWVLWVDFENTYDATWFGAPVHYRDGQVPDTLPILTDDAKHGLLDEAPPDPFAGTWPERCLQFLEDWEARRQHGWTWRGRPVGKPLPPSYIGTDGIFTAAVALRGATELCTDLLMDPDYAHALLQYIYEAVRRRMRAWRDKLSIRIPCDDFILADDAIQMLSVDQFREFVLPWHRKLYDEFATQTRRGMHLCGNAQRHFAVLHDECNVVAFDTGFPVDFAAFRRDLGPHVLISGGPPVRFFIEDDPAPIVAEVERICRSGVLEGGRVILQEANNLPPSARLRVCEAFYEACKRYGVRQD
jgi:hypothetical protein